MGDKAIVALAGAGASRGTCGYLWPSSAGGILVLVALMLLGCNGKDHLRPSPQASMECPEIATLEDAGRHVTLGCDNNGCCCAPPGGDYFDGKDYSIVSSNRGGGCVDDATGEFQIGEGAQITYKGKVIEGPAQGNLHEIE